MNFYEEPVGHEEQPQNIVQALHDEKICLTLAHAACILMAADQKLNPYDAAMDACQAYCHLLDLHAQHKGSAV